MFIVSSEFDIVRFVFSIYCEVHTTITTTHAGNQQLSEEFFKGLAGVTAGMHEHIGVAAGRRLMILLPLMYMLVNPAT